MIKTIFICSLLCSTLFAQDLQSLAAQANAATGNALADDLTQVGNSLSLILNEYEWVLSEENGEYALNVNQLSNNANNLGPALDSLIGNANAAQNNAADIGNLLSTEAESLGVVVQDNNGALAGAAGQYAEQLQDNAESVSASVQDSYNQVAANLASNSNGLNDQVNQQINQAVQDQAATSQNVENLVAGALNSLPNSVPENLVQVNGNTASLADAANNLAAGADLSSLANQASGAVNSLPSDVAGAANNAANAAANTAVNNAGANAAADNAVAAANNAVAGN